VVEFIDFIVIIKLFIVLSLFVNIERILMNIENYIKQDNSKVELCDALILELVKYTDTGIIEEDLFAALKNNIIEDGRETKISKFHRVLNDFESRGLIVRNKSIIKIKSNKGDLLGLLKSEDIVKIIDMD